MGVDRSPGQAPGAHAVGDGAHDTALRQARAAGFDHHLLKPLEPAALRALLDEIEPR